MPAFALMRCLLASLVVLLSASAVATSAKQLGSSDINLSQQKAYEQAIRAIRAGKHDQAASQRDALKNYPLAVYFDYYLLGANLSRVNDAQAQAFIALASDTPLASRFRTRYLKQLGQRGRWQSFLALQPSRPDSARLQCYYDRAQLNAGHKAKAWAGARQLWLHGRSRSKACDPLFSAWRRAGQLDDGLVWQRALLAFDAGQRPLLKYLSTLGSKSMKKLSALLLDVYDKPARVLTTTWSTRSVYARAIVAHGLKRLAKRDPRRALRHWQDLADTQRLDDNAQSAIMRVLASQVIRKELAGATQWLDTVALPRLQDERLFARRLRWLLAEQDWRHIGTLLASAPDSQRNKARWRYWQAFIDDKNGNTGKASSQWRSLASERGYYAFLAAEALGQPYTMNNMPPTNLPAVTLEDGNDLVLARIGELLHHNDSEFALLEWHQLLRSASASQRQALAQYALDNGWYRMAIDGANRAGAHDWLSARFPQAYQASFERHANTWRLPPTELAAIARRESAFLPQARSPVGARGLMQLMPATGKHVAKRLGRRFSTARLYQVDENITLGSAYYRELLDRYQGNRVLALAAYNAGMHRVNRWHKKDRASLPVNLWVDTIPFKETRAYVQAVLAYNVVFSHLQGRQASLFTDTERQSVY